ncbi:MAG: hypothetical protein CVV44_01560 [Spirochaetae bacterium HGW-Spirochaetae-1]|nr:MAG: hypothetical protein CVV44_01560 [Spirochaetae bacterium HGW-Spirochaetae-1]
MMYADKRVLSIFGSPRGKGYSSVIHHHLLDGIKRHSLEVEEFHVHDRDIRPCTACGHCIEKFSCIHDDDMSRIYPLLRDTAMITISSPVYFSGLNGKLKIFIDRCQVLWELNRRAPGDIAGKEALFVSAAGSDYPHVFVPSKITIRHLFNSLRARFNEDDYILLAGTDSMTEVPHEVREKTTGLAVKYAGRLIEL